MHALRRGEYTIDNYFPRPIDHAGEGHPGTHPPPPSTPPNERYLLRTRSALFSAKRNQLLIAILIKHRFKTEVVGKLCGHDVVGIGILCVGDELCPFLIGVKPLVVEVDVVLLDEGFKLLVFLELGVGTYVCTEVNRPLFLVCKKENND